MHYLTFFSFFVSFILGGNIIQVALADQNDQYEANNVCYNVSTKSDFDFTKFMDSSKWFEIQRTGNSLEKSCLSVSFTNHSTILMLNFEEFSETVLGNCRETGEMTLQVDGIGMMNFVIIDTDYANFAILYACMNGTGRDPPTEFAWLLSKRSDANFNDIMSSSALDEHAYVKNLFDTNAVCGKEETTEYVQSSTAAPGEVCYNVSMISGFSLYVFMDDEPWYEIQRTKNSFESECSSINFLSNTGITFTMQLEGQEYPFNGTHEGKQWNVTLPEGDFNFVVVNDNHTNYAVVYACRNETETSQLTELVWLLSRSPYDNLENLADQDAFGGHDYLRSLLEKDTVCEYKSSPSTTEGTSTKETTVSSTTSEPVKGLCYNASNVLGFNPFAFMDGYEWYEVQRTNNSFESQCKSMNYTFGGAAFNMKFEEIEGDSIGFYRPGEGMTVNLPDGKMYNLFVVNTNYTDFAVLYACREPDRTSDFSEMLWLLSRSNSTNWSESEKPYLFAEDDYLLRLLNGRTACQMTEPESTTKQAGDTDTDNGTSLLLPSLFYCIFSIYLGLGFQ